MQFIFCACNSVAGVTIGIVVVVIFVDAVVVAVFVAFMRTNVSSFKIMWYIRYMRALLHTNTHIHRY